MSSIVHTLNPSIEAVDAELLRVYDHIVKDYPDLIIETGRTETAISYKLHELVPFSIGLCREMVVRDNSNKETLGVRILNRGDIAVRRTANGLGESFFVFLLDN